MKARVSLLLEWVLLGVGVVCLGIYGYQTLEARRFQAEQAEAFQRAEARTTGGAADEPRATPTSPPSAAATGEASRPARTAAAVRTGSLLGMLDVPRLGLSTPVVEGDDDRTLQKAAGHLPDTPLPWQTGNSAVAAHRDGLFRPLKDVKVGDEIRFRTPDGEIRYRVTATTIVLPDELWVLAPQPRETLTLITCFPFNYVGNAPKRFIVHAERQ